MSDGSAGGDLGTRPLVVVMGVSGTGKTVVGTELARRLAMPYADGDDFHSDANRSKMASGAPLTDSDRWPWLGDVAAWLREHEETGGVVSCSALKRAHRDVLRGGSRRAFFLQLHGDPGTIAARMKDREHFMGTDMLDSQLADLEPLADDESGRVVDIEQSPEQIVEAVVGDGDEGRSGKMKP